MVTPNSVSFDQAWLCEAIRLQETQWGSRDDSKARLLAQAETSALAKITKRAMVLGQDTGLVNALTQIKRAGWIGLLIIGVFALFAGSASAFTALGNGTAAVNVIWGFISLLALNLISMLIWCISMLFPSATGGWFPQLWPWLTRKLVRGPSIGLAAQAWWHLWHQARATRWIMSAGTHLIWLTLSLAAVITLVVLLSLRQYDFVWSTTLLSSDVFVKGVSVLGVLPQWFGFMVPDSEVIRLSGNISTSDAPATRLLWSSWLLGSLVVYGVIPRALLALFSIVMILKGLKRTKPDLSAPYYTAVLSRMTPAFSAPDGMPPAAAALTLTTGSTQHHDNDWQTDFILTAIELDPTETWPPLGIGAAVTCTSMIDTRDSRQQLLSTLARTKPTRLVIACDARHTPDRGTLRIIADLAGLSKKTLLWLRQSQDVASHAEAWREQLQQLPGIELLATQDPQAIMQWFRQAHD